MSKVGARAAKTSLNQLFVQHKCTIMDKSMKTICSSHFPLYRDLPLYEAHQIRRAYSLGIGEV